MAETIVSVVLKTKGQEKLDRLKSGIDATSKKLDQLKGKLGRGIQSQFQQLGQAGINAGNKIKRGFEVAGKAASGLEKRVGGLRSQLLGLGVGAGLAKAFGDASALEATESRVGLLVKRYEQLDGIQNIAAQSAEKFRLTQTSALGDLIDLGNRLGASGTSLEDIKTVYEGLNTVLAVNKVEAAQAASATLQLNQALGSGRLAGEEFNAINEATPQVIDAVAKVLGVARGEVKKLASEGKVTRDVLIKAFAQINNEFGGDLEQTFSGAFGATRDFNVALKEFSETVGKELLPVITPLLQGAADLLKAFGELPGPVKTTAVALAAIGTAGLLAAPAIAAVVKGAIGLLGALGAAKLGAAAAGVTKLGLAFTGLKAAVAFLSGPVGLLIAGVTAVGVGAVAATSKINNFNNEINKTTTASSETANQIALVEGRLQKLQGELAGSGNSARGLRRQVEELKARLEELKGTYKVQIEIETLFSGQGAIFEGIKSSGFGKGAQGLTYTVAGITYDAKTGQPVAPPKPVKVPSPIVPSGGGGGGGGGGGAAPQNDTDQATALSRELSQQIQLLKEAEGLDRDRLANFFEQENQLKRISELQNISPALRSQLEAQTEELGVLRDTELVLDSVFQKTGDVIQQAFDALTPLQQQGQLLEARLNGTEKEVALQIKIAETIRGLPPELAKLVEEQIRYNAALEDSVAKQAELDSLYQGIGNTIENGIINAIDAGITALIDGTESLDEALKKIAAGVLKDIGRQLISFGVKGLLGSTNLPFFAEGGRPEPGKPAIVGEKGPELFVPDTAGTVVPNDEAFNDARSALVSTSGRPATADEESEAFAVAASALARNSQTINNRNEQQTQSVFNETMMNAAAGGMQVNYNGPKLTFNEADYVPAAAVPEIVTSAVKQSTAKVFADMKNRPSVRRSLGMA